MFVSYRRDTWIAKCDKCGALNYGDDMEFAPLQVPGGGVSDQFICKRHKVTYQPLNDLALLTFDDPHPVPVARMDSTSEVVAEPAVPTITSLSPNSTTVSLLKASPTLTIVGTNFSSFYPRSRVRWAGQELVTTFVSATQITANAPVGLIVAGTHAIDVLNDGPPFRQGNGLGTLNLSNTMSLVLGAG